MTGDTKNEPTRRRRVASYLLLLVFVPVIAGFGIMNGEPAAFIFLRATVAGTLLFLIARAFGFRKVLASDKSSLSFENIDERLAYSLAFAAMLVAVLARLDSSLLSLVLLFLFSFLAMAAYMFFLRDRLPDWTPFGK